MKIRTRIVAAALAAVFVTLLMGGCSAQKADENSIPWSRPAGWEGQIPGMGSTPGGPN